MVHPGAPATTIAERIATATIRRPTAVRLAVLPDKWTSRHRVRPGADRWLRLPSFDMQMQSAYSAIIDPVPPGVTLVTASTSCPLSAVGPAMRGGVLRPDTNGNDAIRCSSPAAPSRHNFAMSGANSAVTRCSPVPAASSPT